LRRLDRVDALTIEQIRVERTADRRVAIRGIVNSQVRRGELLSSLRDLPASHLRINLLTLDEAARQQRSAATSILSPLRSAEVTNHRQRAAFEQVQRFLTASGAAGGDEAVRDYCSALLSRSLRARVEAGTVRDLVRQVLRSDAPHLSPASLTAWRDLTQR